MYKKCGPRGRGKSGGATEDELARTWRRGFKDLGCLESALNLVSSLENSIPRGVNGISYFKREWGKDFKTK